MRLPKVCSVAGSVILNTISRPSFYWGNMSVYVMSYLLQRGKSGAAMNTSWFMFTYDFGWAFAMLFSDILTKWIRARCIILTGIILFNCFLFGSAFSSGISWAFYVMFFGFLAGIALGLFECLVLQVYVIEWADKDAGMLTSVYTSSAVLGGAVLNQFMAWHVNPRNLSPDWKVSSTMLFSQNEVLNNIPSMFLIMGGVNLTLQAIGFCMLRDQQNSSEINSLELLEINCENESNQGTDESSGTVEKQQNSDDTIWNLVRSRDFQKLWFIWFCLGHAPDLIISFYKVYSQAWIKNDHYFSDLGTAMSLCGIVSTFIWGPVIDKLGVKLSFIGMSALMPLFCLAMYFTAMINKWAYFAVTLGAYCLSCSLYICILVSVYILFGKRHLTRNMALISTAAFLSALSISTVSEILLLYIGWFSVFAWTAVLGVVALLVVLTFRNKD